MVPISLFLEAGLGACEPGAKQFHVRYPVQVTGRGIAGQIGAQMRKAAQIGFFVVQARKGEQFSKSDERNCIRIPSPVATYVIAWGCRAPRTRGTSPGTG